MGTIGIPFTEEMYGMIVREAKRRNIQTETLLKIWILERDKAESSKIQHVANDPFTDIILFPLKLACITTASAKVMISMLVGRLLRLS